MGWETLRLEGWQLPDWAETENPDVVIFATMPDATRISQQLSRTLLGCGADWLPNLPAKLLQRKIELTTLASALMMSEGCFIKSAITKHLPGKIWLADELRDAAQKHHPELLVLVAEPVKFLVEYRCFVAQRQIAAISLYRRYEQVFDDTANNMNETAQEVAAAHEFAESVIRSPDVDCPPAFVLDVGIVEGRDWAVVEANECWASGIYYCDPQKVLDVLRHACIPEKPRAEVHEKWDFAMHYSAAVPQ